MPPTIQFPNPIRMDRLTCLFWIRGVGVYVHWTVLVIAAILVWGTIKKPWLTLAGGASWLALVLLHECGHMVAAHRKKCRVLGIYLYPIHGLCRFEQPWSRFDHCVIAWGGVIAQMVVALPIVIWVTLFGYSRFGPLNAVLAILGGYSVLLAAFNLIPAGSLDGALAWAIIPEFIRRMKLRRKKKVASSDWRTY